MTRSNSQRGFALIAAIFLLIVLALASSMMVNLSGVQRRTSAFSLLGDRAYHAAASGVEWGIYQALASGCPGTTTLNLSEGGLKGFDVEVSCSSSSHDEGSATTTTYVIEAVAEYGSYGDQDYVKRRMRSVVTNAL